MILRKRHIWEKSGPSVMAYDACNQSDCSILWSLVSLEGINQYLIFLHWDKQQGKVWSETTTVG